MSERNILSEILERKRGEIGRRRRWAHCWEAERSKPAAASPSRADHAVAALRRPSGAPPRIIAEIKHRSPSAGTIRQRVAGGAQRVALEYERGGASAVSVLADYPSFGGSPLDVRRVASEVKLPVLFKEFVLDEVQADLARAMGASMVLLLVRALSTPDLDRLVAAIQARGMEPVVEAADRAELDRALATSARIVGVNARDLRTFRVDLERARDALAEAPSDRVTVFMSGVRSVEEMRIAADSRADAVLIGEGLMRAPSPGEALHELLRRLEGPEEGDEPSANGGR